MHRISIVQTARVKSFAEELADFYVLHEAMVGGRMFWSPQAGAGSQGWETGAQCLLAKATLAMAGEIERKFAEDDG